MLPYWYGSHRLAASARWRCTEPLRPGVGICANERRRGSGRSDHAPTNARTCRFANNPWTRLLRDQLRAGRDTGGPLHDDGANRTPSRCSQRHCTRSAARAPGPPCRQGRGPPRPARSRGSSYLSAGKRLGRAATPLSRHPNGNLVEQSEFDRQHVPILSSRPADTTAESDRPGEQPSAVASIGPLTSTN